MKQIKNAVTLYLLQEIEKKKTDEIQDDYFAGHRQGKISTFEWFLELLSKTEERRPSKIVYKSVL